MIYITGDCHGEYGKFNTKNFPEQKTLTKDDYVIICGDFGAIWSNDINNKTEKYNLDLLENRPFTTLFIDGNHENFDRLNAYPVETWNGGNIHRIRPSILHLMRGQIFEIEGKSIFTFGGASSHDIDAGVLDREDSLFQEKKKELDRDYIFYRINHESWWKEELANTYEMGKGIENLEKHNSKVDYIITHCCSTETQRKFAGNILKSDCQTDYFDEIRNMCTYDKWYFGHYHGNSNISRKDIMLYDSIISLGSTFTKTGLGYPQYYRGDIVRFTWTYKNNEPLSLIGKVLIVDAHGTFFQSDEPSYDIYVNDKDGGMLYKHVCESDIQELVGEEKENGND